MAACDATHHYKVRAGARDEHASTRGSLRDLHLISVLLLALI